MMNRKNIFLFFCWVIGFSSFGGENKTIPGIGFTENRGQIIDTENNPRPDILFSTELSGVNYFIRKTGVSYVIRDNDNYDIDSSFSKTYNKTITLRTHRIDLDFINANANSAIEKKEKNNFYSNYYLENCPAGVMNVSSYNSIIQKEIYEGIDINYINTNSQFKYNIIINPQANPGQIKMRYSGADDVILENGIIKIKTSLGDIEEYMPKVYQDVSGRIIDVKAKYIFVQSEEEKYITIQLGEYRKDFALIIDPWVTYAGGVGIDYGMSVDHDSNGNIFFTGAVQSTNFPILGSYVYQSNVGGGYDACVTQFSSNGNPVWSTFFGGAAREYGYGIHVDKLDNIYITGFTESNNLPVYAAAAQTSWQTTKSSLGTGLDAFVAKFDNSGHLIWSTYYGGSSDDEGRDIVTDNNGDVIVVGITGSSAPVNSIATAGSFQPALNGTNDDMFVVKFSSSGNRIWGTYCGGNGNEAGGDICVDNLNDIYIAGLTASSNFPRFPTTCHQPAYGGGAVDGFLFKFNSAGTRIWATFYGGSGSDGANAIAVDNNNCVIIGGQTNSTAPLNSISTPGSYQPALNGTTGTDAFVAKFNSSGTRLWATYIGGNTSPTTNRNCYLTGLDVAANNDIAICGDTYCNDFPVTSCAFQPQFKGKEDVFLSTFSSAGQLICSTNIGNAGANIINPNFDNESFSNGGGALIVDGGFVYIVGSSQNFPVTSGAFQFNPGGNFDITLSQLCLNSCGMNPLTFDFSASPTTVCSGGAVNFSVTNTTCDTVGTTYLWSFSGAATSTSTDKNAAGIIYNVPGTYDVKLKLITPCGTDSLIKYAYINVAPTPSATINVLKNISCNGFNNGILEANVTGATNPITYIWSNNASTAVISNLAVGSYSVLVIDGNGCSAAASTVMSQPAVLQSFIPSQTDVKCNGESTGAAWGSALGGTLPYTYAWSNGMTGQTISNLNSGNVQLTITDANGCTATASTNITQPSLLSTSVTGTSNLLCYNDGSGIITTITSGGVAPYSYTWNNNNTTSSISGIAAGIYILEVRDAYNCITTNSITITEPAQLTSAIVSIKDETCSGKNDGAIVSGVSGGVAPYNYTWSNGHLFPSMSNLGAGVYTLTVTDVNNCTSVIQSTILAAVALTSSVTTTPVKCFGESNGGIMVAINGGAPAYNYIWSNNTTTQNASNLSAGLYTLTVSDANGCNISITATVTQPPQLVLSISPSASICEGQSYSVTSAVSGGVPGYFYQWMNGQTGSSISISPSIMTLYTLTVTDVNSCSAVQTGLLGVNTLPQIEFSCNMQQACAPACITFSNTTANTFSAAWQFTNTMQNGNAITNCYSSAGVYGVTLTVTDNNGCSNSLSDANYITIHPSPIAAFVSSANPATLLEPTIQFTNHSKNFISSNWSFGKEEGVSALTNPTHTYSDSGNYNVQLIVVNEFGCADTATETIRINPDFAIYVPNTFTPNYDGRNDVFVPVGEGITANEYLFIVYDRWGKEIFKTTKPGEGWDGKANDGKLIAQIDTYVWKLVCVGITGEKKRIVGAVNLIK